MRGREQRCGELFSYVDIEARIRADHPLRTIKVLVGEALDALSGDSEALYMPIRWDGRRSRRNVCSGRYCCRHSIRYDLGGS